MSGSRVEASARIRICVMVLLALVGCSKTTLAQNWSFDARTIALGGVGSGGHLATKMIDEQRDYTSIVLPFGLLQLFGDRDKFNPDSKQFDLVRSLEYAASPIHFVIGRSGENTSEALVNDIRNATLSRDLARYKGFAPANSILAEGLASPNFGGTIKVRKSANGGFQGIYIGAGPYLSMRNLATIDQKFTEVLRTGVNLQNAQFPITNATVGQLALAVTGGYRGRFALPMGLGGGTPREGLYVAANYNYLHGFRYENIDMTIRLDTDRTGLITLLPATTPIVISRREGKSGKGFALDVGVGLVADRWEIGFGANGIANRIEWTGIEQTVYSLSSALSGNSDFKESATVAVPDTRLELPVDYRGNARYSAGGWSAAAEIGNGFGGRSFHGGLEGRLGMVELRAGARYTVGKWNQTGGIGFDFSRRLSLDLAAFGTNTNIERKRQTAIAASLRFNHRK